MDGTLYIRESTHRASSLWRHIGFSLEYPRVEFLKLNEAAVTYVLNTNQTLKCNIVVAETEGLMLLPKRVIVHDPEPVPSITHLQPSLMLPLIYLIFQVDVFQDGFQNKTI
jgi:hypothetical protein